jgi:hypothetical protein
MTAARVYRHPHPYPAEHVHDAGDELILIIAHLALTLLRTTGQIGTLWPLPGRWRP